jgi:molecular chaperone GrpE
MNDNRQQQTASTTPEPSTTQPAEAPTVSPAPDLAAQVEALTAERAELHDRLLRRQADYENLRRRTAKEKEEIREFAAMSCVGALLPILDDFERALTVECADPDYRKGMLLIYQRMFETLQKLGLETIRAEGQKFDPHVHHAAETVQTSEFEDHTVIAELQKGYSFRGKLLRPAMVKVAVAPLDKGGA